MATVTQQRPGRKPVRRTAKPAPAKVAGKPAGQRGFLGRSPLGIVVYGPSGVGKTSFAAHFPNCGFVYDPQEEGILDLVEYGQAPAPVFDQEVSTFEDLLGVCEDIAAGNHAVETVVFDSLTGLERLAFAFHCREYFDDDWSAKGFYSFQQGPKNAAKTDIPRMLDAFDSVRRAGVNVVLLAHSQVKVYSNPEGSDYDRFIPVCDKETWQQVHRWAKAVLFYNYYVDVDSRRSKEAAAFRKGKAKAGSEARYLYSTWSPSYDAKNRYDLDSLIDVGGSGEEAFDGFCKAFKK